MRISYCGQMWQILWPNFHVLNLVLFIIAPRSEFLVGVICNRQILINKLYIVNEHKLKMRTSGKMIPYILKMYTSYWYFEEIVTRITRRVPLVEQELLILPSTWFHSRFLVVFVLFDLWFVLCACCVGNCLSVCPLCCLYFHSSIYGLWLPRWYLQTLLIRF
jgi:hypothetical protein